MVEKKPEKKKDNEEVSEPKEKRVDRENRFLKNLFIFFGIVLAGFIIGSFAFSEAVEFQYRGVNFTIVEFCDAKPCLKTYNTKLPVLDKGGRADYNFYLRNDPRKLEEQVPFNGDLQIPKSAAIDVTYNRICQGYSSIAMDNFGILMKIMNVNITAEEGLSCESGINEMQVIVQEGEETKVERIGSACYIIEIKECEVLSGMERFMIEMFVEIRDNSI
ncbi:MAG: hypothetical protein KKB79_02930 [Nanoarchaeota archaeon]|nr:hypothetical protein [Nanoarchaeota archaeon]